MILTLGIYQVLAELQEEEEMEQCMEEMLAEEEARDTTYYYIEDQNPAVTLMPCPNFLNILHDDIGMLQSMATLGFYDDGVLVVQVIVILKYFLHLFENSCLILGGGGVGKATTTIRFFSFRVN